MQFRHLPLFVTALFGYKLGMSEHKELENQCSESFAAKGPLSVSFGSSVGKRSFTPFAKVMLGAFAVIVGSVTANAAFTYTFTPPVDPSTGASDLGDLDHHNAYGWILSGLDTTKTYTSASLKITNINNWDLTKNTLFIHLFDTLNTAPSGTGVFANVGSGNNIVTSFQDVATSQVPVTTISDAFSGSGILGTDLLTNPLRDTTVPVNTNNILLGTYVDGSFASNLGTVDGVTVANYNSTYTPPAATQATNAAQTVTYNFNALQLQKLNEYISGGVSGGDNGRIAFGFDSDCHFFNDGIEFTMISDVAPPPVPEPATALAGVACLVPILNSAFGRRRKPLAL